MKVLSSILVCALALLLPAIPSCSGAPSGESWEVPYFNFEPMSAEKQANLRRAFAECTKVEMVYEWCDSDWQFRTCSDKRWRLVERTERSGPYSWKRRQWVRELRQGAELDAILSKLAAVPQWYTPVFNKQLMYEPGTMLGIRLLNAEGKELYVEEIYFGPWTSCEGAQGERVSLASFFPDFPSIKCFGK